MNSTPNFQLSNPPQNLSLLTDTARVLIVGDDGATYRATLAELRTTLSSNAPVESVIVWDNNSNSLHITTTQARVGIIRVTGDAPPDADVSFPFGYVGVVTVINEATPEGELLIVSREGDGRRETIIRNMGAVLYVGFGQDDGGVYRLQM